jgi:HlyD family secretion protein
MDRALPKEIIGKRKQKYFISGAAILIFLPISFFLFQLFLSPGVDSSRIIVASAEYGAIESSITASGTVVPKYELAVTSPVETNILSVFHKAGEKIKKGDQLLKLNKEFLQISCEKLKDELELKKNKKLQKIINLKNSNAERKSEYDIQELTVKFNESKLNREERLAKIGGATVENLEQARLSLDKSAKEKEKLHIQMENQNKLQQAEIAELDLEIKIQEKNLSQIERQLELAEMHAESDGIITWINDKTGTTVSSGEVIARISDFSGYVIDCQISDIHSSEIFPGGRVKIKLDNDCATGRITSVNPVVSNGSVSFTVNIAKEYFPRLRPNQHIEVFVMTSVSKQVLRIKNGPFYNGFASQDLFVVSGKKAVKRSVEFGDMGMDYIEIKGGLRKGERIIISDMKSYENYSVLKIK